MSPKRFQLCHVALVLVTEVVISLLMTGPLAERRGEMIPITGIVRAVMGAVMSPIAMAEGKGSRATIGGMTTIVRIVAAMIAATEGAMTDVVSGHATALSVQGGAMTALECMTGLGEVLALDVAVRVTGEGDHLLELGSLVLVGLVVVRVAVTTATKWGIS